MVLTRAQNSQLYTPIYDKAWLEGYGSFKSKCLQVFEKWNDNSKEMKIDSLSDLKLYQEFKELESVPKDTLKQLNAKTFVHHKYGTRIEVSYEAIDDDEYALLKKTTTAEKYGLLAAQTAERQMTRVFSDLFDGTYYTSQDGAAICGNHTLAVEGSTVSNKITTAASSDALEELEQKIIDNGKNSRGTIAPLLPQCKFLFCHPKRVRKWQTILSERALLKPGSADNDINVFAGTYTLLSLDWLADFSGTTEYFGLVIPNAGLVFIERKRNAFTSWINNDIQSYIFDGWLRFVEGCYDWRAVWASNGTT